MELSERVCLPRCTLMQRNIGNWLRPVRVLTCSNKRVYMSSKCTLVQWNIGSWLRPIHVLTCPNKYSSKTCVLFSLQQHTTNVILAKKLYLFEQLSPFFKQTENFLVGRPLTTVYDQSWQLLRPCDNVLRPIRCTVAVALPLNTVSNLHFDSAGGGLFAHLSLQQKLYNTLSNCRVIACRDVNKVPQAQLCFL